MSADPGFVDLGFSRPDTDRLGRTGFGEVVYCAGKTPEQTAAIFYTLHRAQGAVLGTRATEAHYDAVKGLMPAAKYSPEARCLSVGSGAPRDATQHPQGRVALVAAGTSDLPVAAEAEFTLQFLGVGTERFIDCGVAGLHRLLAVQDKIDACRVVIVVAGMEGALPSVVGGLTGRPVIAVPTSVGYGSSLHGITALLGMLNSCAPGLMVCNIDNGFGAALAAARILRANAG